MKTITVREAAKALNLTKRAIMYRLEGGKLKGIRVRNDFGVDEWRIYPTKEIIEGLQRAMAANPTTEQVVGDAIYDTDEVVFEGDDLHEPSSEFPSWDEKQREGLRLLADELVRPILEKLDQQTRLLALREQELEDLKVKLLPDLEKRIEDANLKHFEVEALKKQLSEVEALRNEAFEQVEKAVNVQETVLPELRKQVETDKVSIAALSEDLRRERDAAKNLSEIVEQGDKEKAALQVDLEALKKELEQLKKPWWKKWFEAPPTE